MEEYVNAVVQDFFGSEYFLYREVNYESRIFHVFSKIDEPSKLIVAEKVVENNEEYYDIIKDELSLTILSLCENETN